MCETILYVDWRRINPKVSVYVHVCKEQEGWPPYEIKMKGLKCHWTEINMNSWVSNA